MLKFAAGFILSVVGVVVVLWSTPATSEIIALLSDFPGLISDPPSFLMWFVVAMTAVFTNLGKFDPVFDFLKTCIGWKSHAKQIDLGKHELQHAQEKLKLEYERLQLERDILQLEREKFEWERTVRSLSSQSQAVTYDLAGTISPEVVTFGEGPTDKSDAPDLSNDQTQYSESESRNRGA